MLSLAGDALLDPNWLRASVLLLGLSGICIYNDRYFFIASGRDKSSGLSKDEGIFY